MMVDALSCMFGALVGTSTSGAYIESATGIREGARTGLAALSPRRLFAAALFFLPLVEPLQTRSRFVYAPALIAVGIAMLPAVRGLDFDDPTELVPAVATIAMMVFTLQHRERADRGPDAPPAAQAPRRARARGARRRLVLALLCAIYYPFGLPHEVGGPGAAPPRACASRR